MVAVRPWRLRFEAGATFWASQTASVPDSTTETGDFSLVSAVGRAGYGVSQGAFEFVPSLLVEAEFMSGVAEHVSRSEPNSSTWFAIGGGGWVFWSVTREIAVRLGVEAALPLARPTFQVTEGTGGATVFHAPFIGGKGAIGLELRFL